MKLRERMTLLITRDGQFVDRARIERIEKRGSKRLLHIKSLWHSDERTYLIEETGEGLWEQLFIDGSADKYISCERDPIPVDLEII